MRLIGQRYYHDGNICSPRSGLALVLQAEDVEAPFWAWRPVAAQAEAAVEMLGGIFPAARDDHGAYDCERICRATVPAVELLLQTVAGLLADFCVSPATGHLIGGRDGQFTLFLPSEDPDIAAPACKLLLHVPAILSGASNPQPVEELLEIANREYWAFRRTARQHGANQTNLVLAQAARSRGIPSYRLPIAGPHLQLGQGRHRQRIIETVTEQTGALARALSKDKLWTGSLLSAAGIPTAGSQQVATPEDAVRVALKLGYPVVVKPRSAGKGRGVSVKLSRDADVVAAFERAQQVGSDVIVERFIHGHDHRVLVVAGRFIACAQRQPAAVLGDGAHTVRELVDALNVDPRRGPPFDRLLEWVAVDEEALQCLADQDLSVDSIPQAGRKITLRGTANLSRGGTSVDLTEITHPDNRALMERVARLVGLDVTGIDFLTPDIGRSWREIPCAVLEVNSSPGLRPHLASNPNHDVAGPVIDHLFPGGSDGRVPTVGVTGSLGKTTTCRMLASMLAEGGLTVALTTTQGAYVGTDQVRSGDSSGGRSARSLLLDPRVEAGVFEFARGALIKRGMVLDACDVGVVLNVLDNHIGVDGIRSREELARVKRLVVAQARKLAILNADDPLCLAMRGTLSAPRLCLVSTADNNPALLAHQAQGGFAAYFSGQGRDRELVLCEASTPLGSLPIREIPATLDGQFEPPAINALFASAAAVGMGLPFDVVCAALRSFQSNHDRNPGRMNFVEGLPFQLIINWTDGPAAVRETARLVEQIAVAGRKTLVMTSIGNRPDSFIRDSALAASACFSRYVCADAVDLRGRPAGAVAQLLANSLRDAGTDLSAIEVIPDHDAAIRAALSGAGPGDLVVVLSYTGERAWSLAQSHRDPAQNTNAGD